MPRDLDAPGYPATPTLPRLYRAALVGVACVSAAVTMIVAVAAHGWVGTS